MSGKSLGGPFAARGNFFKIAARSPEVVPVVIAVTIGCIGGVYCLARSATRPDVVWSGKQAEPWNRVKQTTNFKFPFAHHVVTPVEGEDLRGKM